ncbi:conserved hypothetical protein [Gloeothece citriformis PCC 7424]|uniref:Uncharacterized protein n=1 Tax=Gloeothece citriformis (strain PCC 7424) TaxID=65393 RepID=B7KI70_GLOC7|nr:hypothetical protein [Gloeothece citriformis]ACK73557.1 conserved hypothetical protein [Gloeothece citriformis PCC 7424]
MNNQIGFILKVLLLSAALSILIKYGGTKIAIAPTPLNALIGISLVPIIMLIALWWRSVQQQN